MKPFNLQAALAGAAVVTRGGKKVSRLMYVPEINNGTYTVLALQLRWTDAINDAERHPDEN